MPLLRSLRHTRGAALLALSTFLAGCDSITGLDGELRSEQRDLSRARRAWNDVLVRDYDYIVRRNCECLLGGVAVRVSVRDDYVVALSRASTGEPISLAYESVYPSIDGLFGRVQSAIDRRAWEIDASYDDYYGFPTDLYIDYDRGYVDDEEEYILLDFYPFR